MRIRLYKLAPAERVLLVVLHHIITDAESMGVLVQELTQIYAALRQGQAPSLPPLSIQYADYALWQRQYLAEGIQQKQLAYWKQQLKDAPLLLTLPTDFPRPAVQHFEGAVQEFSLENAQVQVLETLAQKNGATLFMTLLAAFQLLLSRYSQTTDILVGTPIANRTRSELERTLGLFVNTLVLRSDLSGNPSFWSCWSGSNGWRSPPTATGMFPLNK